MNKLLPETVLFHTVSGKATTNRTAFGRSIKTLRNDHNHGQLHPAKVFILDIPYRVRKAGLDRYVKTRHRRRLIASFR